MTLRSELLRRLPATIDRSTPTSVLVREALRADGVTVKDRSDVYLESLARARFRIDSIEDEEDEFLEWVEGLDGGRADAYNVAQPRDRIGRWGKGGAAAPSKSMQNPETAAAAKQARASAKAVVLQAKALRDKAKANPTPENWAAAKQADAASKAARAAARKAESATSAAEAQKYATAAASKLTPTKWESSGAVIVDDQGRVALVAPKDGFGGHQWTFPKGRIDPGEDPLQAAAREVREEAGLKIEIGQSLGKHEGSMSVTEYHMAKVTGTTQKNEDETSDVRFVTPAEARQMLTNPRDLKVLELAEKNMPSTAAPVVGQFSKKSFTPQELEAKAKKVTAKNESLFAPKGEYKATTITEASGKSSFTKTDRAAGGSQGGAWYKDEKGEYWFGKDYKGNRDRLGAEHATNELYNLMGVSAPKTKIASVDGKDRIMSPEIKGKEGSGSDVRKSDLKDGFVVDAWLANWDVVGLSFDNVKLAGGKAHRIDNGGSLVFRAMGAKKSFKAPVTELETMRSPSIAPQASRAYADLKPADVNQQLKNFRDKYHQIKPKIDEIVDSSGMSKEIRDEVKSGLHARAKDLIGRIE